MKEPIKYCPICHHRLTTDGSVIKCSNSEEGSNNWKVNELTPCRLSKQWLTIDQWNKITEKG